MKTTKFLKNFVFQTYGVENIKLIASERRSSNIVPEMVLFPNIYIYIYIYIFHLIFEKWMIFFCQQVLMNHLK